MKWALWTGLVGTVVAALGWLLDAGQFYPGWLAAVTLLAAWPLGSMALLLIHALTGGRWGDALRPALQVGVCALPLLAMSLLPIIAGLTSLYPWARPGAHVANHFYLNVPFFAVRGIGYLVLWLGLGWLTLRSRNLTAIAPAGLFFLAITTTFAAIDAIMSLDPDFTSSIYGMLTAAGMVLLALSTAVLLSATARRAIEWEDRGKIVLALVILWIYLDFMQLLIVWQSDLAHDAPWYVDRSRGVWGALRIAIAVGHFILPFFLLLSPGMQRSRRVVLGVAGLLVAMEVLRSWWTVLPSLHREVGWIDVACMIGLGGLAIGTAPWLSERAVVRYG